MNPQKLEVECGDCKKKFLGVKVFFDHWYETHSERARMKRGEI